MTKNHLIILGLTILTFRQKKYNSSLSVDVLNIKIGNTMIYHAVQNFSGLVDGMRLGDIDIY